MRLVLVLCMLFLGSAALAGTESQRRPAPAVRAAAAPTIDGVLDDACWQSATTATDFTMSELQTPLQFPTTAYLCYDDVALYAGMRCEDPEPEKIIAQEFKRNARIWADDLAVLAVAPSHQFGSVYRFYLNPKGAQMETIPGGAARNITWRGDWVAAAKRTPTGWCAEFSIPWKVLQPPRGTKAIGFFFERRVGRLSDRATSPNLGRQGDYRNMAEWTGLDVPDFVPPMKILAYQQATLVEGVQTVGVGLDVKQQTRRGHTWMLTLNPDFENIENSVQSVDFSYTGEQYIWDRRPFFAEGRGGYPASQLFYTPRIQQVSAAVKAFALPIGRLAYDGLITTGENQQHNGMLAASYRFETKPQRFLFTNQTFHHEPGIDNYVANTGGNMEFPGRGGKTWLSGSYTRSFTTGMEGDDRAMDASLRYSANPGRIGYGIRYAEVGPDFNPMLGYCPDTDYRSAGASMGYYNNLAKGWFESCGTGLDVGHSNRFNGDRFQDWHSAWGWADFRNNWWLNFGAGESYRNPWHDNSVSLGFGWNRRSIHRGGNMYGEWGHTNGGLRRYLYASQSFRPLKDLGLRLSMEHSRINYPAGRGEPNYRATQVIASLNYDISPERQLGGRLVMIGDEPGQVFGGGGKSNVYFTFRQEVRKGVDAFLIVGDPNAPEWQSRVALKLLMPL